VINEEAAASQAPVSKHPPKGGKGKGRAQYNPHQWREALIVRVFTPLTLLLVRVRATQSAVLWPTSLSRKTSRSYRLGEQSCAPRK